jgi:hypothetical protein
MWQVCEEAFHAALRLPAIASEHGLFALTARDGWCDRHRVVCDGGEVTEARANAVDR